MEKKLGRPRSEKTKSDILTAAYDLLLEKGFDTVTVEKIAEKAGVSKATIYNGGQIKRELLWRLI